jgi:hypothetical protein
MNHIESSGTAKTLNWSLFRPVKASALSRTGISCQGQGQQGQGQSQGQSDEQRRRNPGTEQQDEGQNQERKQA